MYGATLGGPIKQNRIFSFTSFEQWDDKRPITIVRTVPTELERARRLQPVGAERPRAHHLQPVHLDARRAPAASCGQPFAGNVIPQAMLDPVALKMLARFRCPTRRATPTTGRAASTSSVDYWNFSQRVDVNISDNLKMFARYGQFKADLYQENPTDGGFFPLVGQQPRRHEHRRRRGLGHVEQDDAERARQLLQHDRRVLQPVAAARRGRPRPTTGRRQWYSSLYNSGYVYYPALDVTTARARRPPTASAARAASGTSIPMRGPRRRA